MSQFNKARESGFRRRLLTTVSALALIGAASGAYAGDSDRPVLWIDLGAQWSRLGQSEETFAPDLFDARPSIFTPSQRFERPALYSIDKTGAISFQPEDSDWVLSASIHYGRSTAKRHVRQQTTPEPFVKYITDYYGVRHKQVAYPSGAKFADTNSQNSERHLVVDFQAGKDVGLGMFGQDSSSTINFGVRFAQFSSKSNIALKSDPDWHFYTKYFYGRKIALGGIYHSNAAAFRADRSFHGVGPSISWNASTPLAGNPQDSQLTFDWGLNAAVLFGKQRAKVHHQTTAQNHPALYPQGHRYVIGTPVNANHTRSRSVAVPDIGGFAGLSLRYAAAKVSFGYRADVFFNAVDGGIDARKAANRSFFGPFASISVGLGD